MMVSQCDQALVQVTKDMQRSNASGNAEAFHRALDDHAIRLSFNAERDDFGGRLQTLSRHTGKAFEWLALAVNAPRFDAAPLERVRGQINAMLNANSKSRTPWRRRRGGGPPGRAIPIRALSRGELGEVDTGRARICSHCTRSFWRATRLKIAVVGAIDAANFAGHLDGRFRGACLKNRH